MENFVVLSTFLLLMSNESDDFCRKISDGFTLRSSELDGLSISLRPGDELSIDVGTVGGSTGAARRGNFGGGLLEEEEEI